MQAEYSYCIRITLSASCIYVAAPGTLTVKGRHNYPSSNYAPLLEDVYVSVSGLCHAPDAKHLIIFCTKV
jgi:hypothetical protein